MFSLLAVFAHPDDETFRPGGTLALLAQRGVRVHVLTATPGEAGSIGDPPMCTRDELAHVRREELHCACNALGLEPPILLDYQDGRLANGDPEEIIERINEVATRVDARVMLTFGSDGLSGHPDHIAIGGSATTAYGRLSKIFALYTLAIPRSLAEELGMRHVHPVPDEQVTLCVDVSPVWQSKKAAMACHLTQWAATPLMREPEDRQRLFFGKEFFVRADSRCPELDFFYNLLKEFRR
jgi:LmbE family N-acetylglucosaminyl deacetylase